MNMPVGMATLGALLFVSLGLEGPWAHARDAKKRWNDRYRSEESRNGAPPISFLKEHTHLLPKGGQVLDLAMGTGRNGVYLATKGFHVTGVDISEVGLQKAREFAKELGTSIETQVVNLEDNYQLPANSYDVIILSYYLQRNLFPQIVNALKPGGVVVAETYTQDHLKYNPRFRSKWALKNNELLNQFKGLNVLRYQSIDDGQKAYASILAQRPLPKK